VLLFHPRFLLRLWNKKAQGKGKFFSAGLAIPVNPVSVPNDIYFSRLDEPRRVSPFLIEKSQKTRSQFSTFTGKGKTSLSSVNGLLRVYCLLLNCFVSMMPVEIAIFAPHTLLHCLYVNTRLRFGQHLGNTC
jgi:hypothetical protein